uniref:Uncharacterized protein n=1 Tax=Physcomitrium patens TaxID=3218 RepID=A0A2K1JGN8_PHYPA|nr:hypothetical protein PHYPA_018126 [Physcomitrium patens]
MNQVSAVEVPQIFGDFQHEVDGLSNRERGFPQVSMQQCVQTLVHEFHDDRQIALFQFPVFRLGFRATLHVDLREDLQMLPTESVTLTQ